MSRSRSIFGVFYYTCRFIIQVQANPLYRAYGDRFVVRLPFTPSGRASVKGSSGSCVGLDGILKLINQCKRNKKVFKYIHYVIVQVFIPSNTQCRMLVFNGELTLRNPNKVGSGDGPSLIGRHGHDFDASLKAFALRVVARLQERCPMAITDKLLRVDFFQDVPTETYLVNKVSIILT